MVKPSDVLNRLDAEEEAEFNAWEARIDNTLRCYGGGEKTIDCNASPRVRSRLLTAYQQAGWTVREQCGDQRDPGPWFVFSAKGA